MYYLLGYRILAQPENLLRKDGDRTETPDSDTSRVRLTETQLRRRRQASHFTRSVIFNYTSEEVHTQVIDSCFGFFFFHVLKYLLKTV